MPKYSWDNIYNEWGLAQVKITSKCFYEVGSFSYFVISITGHLIQVTDQIRPMSIWSNTEQIWILAAPYNI